MGLIEAQPGADAQPSTETIGAFLTELYRGVTDGFVTVCWRILKENTGHERDGIGTQWFEPGDVAGMAEFAGQRARTTCVWFGVATRREKLGYGKRGGRKDCLALPALWVDLDVDGLRVTPDGDPASGHGEDAALFPTIDDAYQALGDFPIEPSIVVETGGGLQGFWLLDRSHDIEGSDLLARWRSTWRNRAGALADGVFNADRLMRLPGTVNHKRGCVPVPVAITEARNPATRYRLADLQGWLDTAPARPALTKPKASADGFVRVGGSWMDQVVADFNARTDWGALLDGEFEYLEQKGDVAYWHAVGAQSDTGGTINANGTDRLIVFSETAGNRTGWRTHGQCEAAGEPTTSYDRFSAAMLLETGDDPTTDTAARVEFARLLRSQGYGPPPQPDPPPDVKAQPTNAVRPGRPAIEVTNAAVIADWLRDEIGRGQLAGMFARGPDIVHTPREGEDGYIPLTEGGRDADGPAQVRPVQASTLASRVQYAYAPWKRLKDGDTTPAMFPTSAARVVCDVPDMLPNLRPLRGVVHSPVLRSDGTVLAKPGYDAETGLLHLPEPGLVVPEVADNPTAADVAAAVGLLDQMTAGFAWLTPHDKANYYGLLLTPLLREMVPPPYKLAAIGAPQPGSGKTLLATILRIVHGGVFRSEMPEDEAELRKQVTSILSVTTGAVVHIDNVTGVLRSSTLAGLLTSARWDDRPLGATDMVSRHNDRLWVITGNNLSLGGDLIRRTVWVTVDPKVPEPHLRTGFAIKNLEGWTGEHRGRLLAALLTLIRAWVVAGRPTKPRGSDGFARWVETVDGILGHAGITGTFAHDESARQAIGTDDDDWGEFLVAVREEFGPDAWTVKELLAKVNTSTYGNDVSSEWLAHHPISLDVLPSELAERLGRNGSGPMVIAKSLGRWLRNRDGRWAGVLTVRRAGSDRTRTALWRVESTSDRATDD